MQLEIVAYHKNKGTLAYNGVPIISTSGSYQLDNIKSKIESSGSIHLHLLKCPSRPLGAYLLVQNILDKKAFIFDFQY